MRGLTFRARITLAMVVLAVVGGSMLLGVQYLVVLGAFRAEVRAVQTGNAGPPDQGVEGPPALPTPGSSAPSPSAPYPSSAFPSGAPGDSVGTVTAVQQSVLSTMLVASAVMLAVFALVAGFVAWWLAGRVTSRIGAITRLTREVSGRDLGARLRLSGPRDEIRELGDTIDTMLGRLQDAFERQNRFIANASHELRTPLTAARTALEAPLVQGRFPSDVEPAVRRALGATERGAELIAALLDLARTEEGAAEPAPVPLDVLVGESCDRHVADAEARSVSIVSNLVPTAVSANRTLLAQAVDNLIGNAVRYSPTGASIDVTVRETAEGQPGAQTALVEVSNGGAVLAPAEVEQLVEPFNRGPRSRMSQASGSGLGLTLVDAVARRAGGRLELAARDGGGLIVRLLIPASSHADPTADSADLARPDEC